jgi:AcrR family transcriptional regulator
MAGAKTRAAREPLSRERIETAALELIEREGEGGFSMRKLAAELGCEAMSIYHYFHSLGHLRDALLDRFIASIRRPSDDLPWRERMRETIYGYREAALRLPRFFQYVSLHRTNTATGLAYLEGVLTIFRDAGFDTETAARLFRVVGYYLVGAARDETGGYARGPSAVEPVPDEIAARDYPLITAVNPFFQPAEREATFALGVELLLDGIARIHRDMRRRASVKSMSLSPSASPRARSPRSSSRS